MEGSHGLALSCCMAARNSLKLVMGDFALQGDPLRPALTVGNLNRGHVEVTCPELSPLSPSPTIVAEVDMDAKERLLDLLLLHKLGCPSNEGWRMTAVSFKLPNDADAPLSLPLLGSMSINCSSKNAS